MHSLVQRVYLKFRTPCKFIQFEKLFCFRWLRLEIHIMIYLDILKVLYLILVYI